MKSYLIAGLGNPGREYKDTRHNIGFMVADRLAAELGIRVGRLQQKALVGNGVYLGSKVIIAKPVTYMNLSGQAVTSLIRYYGIEQENFLVVHDDLDLPFGVLRLRPGGGSAGQKGMQSIIEQAGTQEFARLRCGIGRPPGQMEAAAYVLQPFSTQDQAELPVVLDQAVKAIMVFIEFGIDEAMNQFNGPTIKE
ncbi:MAG: aminoacyl-tRNA hydrolase [Anaerolineaceae bacterium]|nr:aminoacyl-tRNA hydrolase [Anaerolineaceae bacterium]